MPCPSWQTRTLAVLGLRDGPGASGASRGAWLLVCALLLVYVLSFAWFYPRAITIADEGNYMRQARLFASGEHTQTKIDPFTGDVVEVRTTRYPVGTALVMTPFVWAFGWRAGFAGAVTCLALGVLFTAAWLREERRSPAWALIILGYPAALVLGRATMSTAPSLAVVALASWLFWRGARRGGAAWLGAGFAAGASLLFRESNVLLLAGFFAGAALRRESRTWQLVVGGLLGAGLRPLSGWLAYGDPLHHKAVSPFGLEYVAANLPLYAVCLLVFVPGGLVAALAYRGARRPEVVGTVAAFVAFYLVYSYSGTETGGLQRLVLGPRFLVPLLPLLAFAMAESVPRAFAALSATGLGGHVRRAAPVAVLCWLLGVALGSVGVHAVLDRYTDTQAAVRDAIQANTPEHSLVITNWKATGKYMDLLDGARLPLDRRSLTRRHVDYLRSRHDDLYLVLLDRSESAFWRRHSEENARFLAEAFHPDPELVYERRFSPVLRLRVFRVAGR